MREKNTSMRTAVAQPSPFKWVAAATLVAALLLAALAGMPGLAAADDGVLHSLRSDTAAWPASESHRASAALPQTGVTKFYAERMRAAAHQNSADADSARWAALGRFYGQASVAQPQTAVTKFYAERMRVQTDLVAVDADSARWAALGRFYGQASAALAQRVDADFAAWPAFDGYRTVAALPQTDVTRFYAERMRVQAGLVAVDADSARWAALGRFYGQASAALPQTRVDADSARWAALGRFYGQASAALPQRVDADFAAWPASDGYNTVTALPQTAVTKFYAERTRVLAGQSSAFAAQTYDQGYVACTFNNNNELASSPFLGLYGQALAC